jgi:hypothetical protein
LLPLGASGRSVRLNGIVYEGLIARLERRRAYELYHSALEVGVPDGRFVIEMTPVAGSDGAERDVVARGSCWYRLGGPVSRLFRYEVRRWRGGSISDIAEAVDSPRVSDDLDQAQRVLEMVPSVPTLVWGRNQLKTGDMRNSNSLISWLLVHVGPDAESIRALSGRTDAWLASRRRRGSPGVP